MDDNAPKSFLGQAREFLNNMDARAWRAVWITSALFVAAAAILVIGRLYLGDQIAIWVRSWLGGAENSHWGFPAAALAFTVAALVGAPQFVLIAACVVAFGPETGFWYAWGATIVSGLATYGLGKVYGRAILQRYSGATGGRFTRFMGDNAFLASLAVRFVPTAPFVVVNAAMAVSGAPLLPFLAGLTAGVLPKTAIVAFAGDVTLDALEGEFGLAVLAALAAVAVWFVGVVIIRRFLRKDDDSDKGKNQKKPDGDE